MDSEGPVIVDIRHISKSYRRGNQVIPVLEDISPAIVAGSFYPQGCRPGKSTLPNLIAARTARLGAITVGGRHHALSKQSLPGALPMSASSSIFTSSRC
jgi:putative ABC transport system ATP-binding protein